MATAAQLPGRTHSMGYQHACVAGRAGPARMYVISLIDDATSTLLARFVRPIPAGSICGAVGVCEALRPATGGV
jgi:hypothetical protein